jgi:hypothetical protein
MAAPQYNPFGALLEGLAGGLNAYVETRMKKDLFESDIRQKQADRQQRAQEFAATRQQASELAKMDRDLRAQIASKEAALAKERNRIEALKVEGAMADQIKDLESKLRMDEEDLNAMRNMLALARMKGGSGDGVDASNYDLTTADGQKAMIHDLLFGPGGSEIGALTEVDPNNLRQRTALYQAAVEQIDSGHLFNGAEGIVGELSNRMPGLFPWRAQPMEGLGPQPSKSGVPNWLREMTQESPLPGGLMPSGPAEQGLEKAAGIYGGAGVRRILQGKDVGEGNVLKGLGKAYWGMARGALNLNRPSDIPAILGGKTEEQQRLEELRKRLEEQSKNQGTKAPQER